jgi:hypothetical protein
VSASKFFVTESRTKGVRHGVRNNENRTLCGRACAAWQMAFVVHANETALGCKQCKRAYVKEASQ